MKDIRQTTHHPYYLFENRKASHLLGTPLLKNKLASFGLVCEIMKQMIIIIRIKYGEKYFSKNTKVFGNA